MRRFGYSLRGRPPVSRKLLVEVSEHQLLLECVVMAYWTYVQSRAVWVLKNFQSLLECLLPQLQPFNGTNARSVVILDNASIHHAKGIVDLIYTINRSIGTVFASI